MLFAWVLGGAITGLAGGLFAHNLGTVQTSDFGFTLSVQLLVAVLLGGASTPIGPVIATMFVVVLPELLRDVIGDEGRIYLYGVALLLVVIFRRDGIFTRKSARAIHAAVKAPFAPLRPGREQ
jgi:branched-chain amino acid transport system permease protein